MFEKNVYTATFGCNVLNVSFRSIWFKAWLKSSFLVDNLEDYPLLKVG